MITRVVAAVPAVGILLAVIGFTSNMQGAAPYKPAGQRSGAAGENASTTATGTVSQVTCAGGLKIQVDTPDGTRTLRRQPGTPLRITAPTHEQENMNPCTSLNGMRVTVEFIPDDKKGMTGTIERVNILPAVESANALLPSNEPRKAAAPKGPLMEKTTSDGRVKKVHCDGKELLITFVVREVEFNLHARDYTRMDIDEGTAMPTGTYDPCTKLTGHDATVTYVLIEKKPCDGEMQAIAVVP
ncbi:MAG: hypothetical protein WB780_18210 [Candidatus Acidiferrales bacterium]